jgi:hypothetical protein
MGSNLPGARSRTAKGTLLFGYKGPTNVRQKARMCRTQLGKGFARLGQAELAVHRQANL